MARRHTLMPRLERYGVTLLTGMEIMETANTGRIRIRDAYGVEEWLEPFDTTAISVGYRPEKMLARELEHMRLPYKAIGDCVAPAGFWTPCIRDWPPHTRCKSRFTA